MSDERLRAQMSDDDARLLAAAARERLAVASADLALPRALRLTDWQRTTVSALVEKLVRTVEDELRISLSESEPARGNPELHAALTSAHVAIAGPILERAGLHADRGLVAAMLRRADEHRRLRARGAGEMGLLIDLIRDEDPAVADLAMAILVAQSRRFDRFSEPAAARTELAAELQHRLVWRVAAALRRYLVEQHQVAPLAADRAAVAAAERLISNYDEGESLEARALRLARRLDSTGRLSDELVERCLADGSLPLFVAALAVRLGLGSAAIGEILSDPRGRGPVMLMKAAGIARPEAASILLSLAASEEEALRQVDLFDVTAPSTAAEALRLWQVDQAYRQAIVELSA